MKVLALLVVAAVAGIGAGTRAALQRNVFVDALRAMHARGGLAHLTSQGRGS